MTSKEMTMKLSICMPTYNFGPFISETLDSIVPQLEEGVEIIILDGGSTDNTSEIVAAYSKNYPQIKYVHQENRGGIDRDMSRSIECSTGEYFWLFSSDDIMNKGAIKYALDKIKSGLDVYLCGLTLCDKEMNIICEHKVSNAEAEEVFDLTNKIDREKYFKQAITTTAFFSFMGSLIMRRSWWDKYPFDEKYDRTCWAHVARMMNHIKDGFRLKYLKESLQLKRGDNDSFMDKGLVHRYAIAIDGYHFIADQIFGNESIEAYHLRRVIAYEYSPKAMIYIKSALTGSQKNHDLQELDRLIKKVYIDNNLKNYISIVLCKVAPVWLCKFAVYGSRFIKKIFHARRNIVNI